MGEVLLKDIQSQVPWTGSPGLLLAPQGNLQKRKVSCETFNSNAIPLLTRLKNWICNSFKKLFCVNHQASNPNDLKNRQFEQKKGPYLGQSTFNQSQLEAHKFAAQRKLKNAIDKQQSREGNIQKLRERLDADCSEKLSGLKKAALDQKATDLDEAIEKNKKKVEQLESKLRQVTEAFKSKTKEIVNEKDEYEKNLAMLRKNQNELAKKTRQEVLDETKKAGQRVGLSTLRIPELESEKKEIQKNLDQCATEVEEAKKEGEKLQAKLEIVGQQAQYAFQQERQLPHEYVKNELNSYINAVSAAKGWDPVLKVSEIQEHVNEHLRGMPIAPVTEEHIRFISQPS